MTQENSIRKIINQATEDIISEEQDPNVALDVDVSIIPDLIREVIDSEDNVDKKQTLEAIQGLITSNAIPIAINGSVTEARSLTEDITLEKSRVGMQDYILVLVVNPAIAYSMASEDDRSKAASRVKEVMFQTYAEYKALLKNGQFISNNWL